MADKDLLGWDRPYFVLCVDCSVLCLPCCRWQLLITSSSQGSPIADMVISRVGVWLIGKCTHGHGGFSQDFRKFVQAGCVQESTQWCIYGRKLTAERELQCSSLMELNISKEALASWSSFCFPLAPLLFLLPHSLQNSKHFAPPGSSSRLPHARCQQSRISHRKAGAAGVAPHLWCLLCWILAICVLW